MENREETSKENSFTFFANGMRTLWDLIGEGGEKRRMARVCALTIIIQILSLGTPYSLKVIFDEIPNMVKTGRFSDYLLYVMAGIFVLGIVNLYLRHFVKDIPMLLGMIHLENFWPAMAQKKLLALSLGYHERENIGKKIAKIERGCDRSLGVLKNFFWDFLPMLSYLTLNMIFILVIDWKLGILFFLPFIPAIWLNLKCFSKFGPMWDKWNEQKEVSSGIFCQSLLNVSTVQQFVQERREIGKFASVRRGMKRLDSEINVKMKKYFFAAEALLATFFLITVVAGIHFVLEGRSTVGSVIYIIATGSVTMGIIWQITNTYTQMLKNLVPVMRLKKLLDEEVDIKNIPGAAVPKNFNGEFKFKNATFVYPRKEKAVLDGINIEIAPNKMTALVSKTGEGKTTIIRLLCRMYDVGGGEISLDGENIKNLDVFWYRKLFAVVQQDVDIFDAGILENIRYSHPEAPVEQALEALRAARLEMVLDNKERFPDGIETQVGERGVRLSGGERQRVGIARAYLALLNGAKVLVLDEATSSLDSEAERAIQEMLDSLRKKMAISIVAIAHRLSTIQKADTIYVIGNGGVLESGDHKRLMSKNGLYAKLVELQKMGDLRE